jgi:hypothetical protein
VSTTEKRLNEALASVVAALPRLRWRVEEGLVPPRVLAEVPGVLGGLAAVAVMDDGGQSWVRFALRNTSTTPSQAGPTLVAAITAYRDEALAEAAALDDILAPPQPPVTSIYYWPSRLEQYRDKGLAVISWTNPDGNRHALRLSTDMVTGMVADLADIRPEGVDTLAWCRAVSDAVRAGARGETGTLEVRP